MVQGDEGAEEQPSLLFQPDSEWTQCLDVIEDDLHRARDRDGEDQRPAEFVESPFINQLKTLPVRLHA